MQQFTSMSSISTSFTSHSSNNFSVIAARVVAEFCNDNSSDNYNFLEDELNIEKSNNQEDEEENQSEEEFEFSVVCKESNWLNISRYPLFDQRLLLNDDVSISDSIPSPVVIPKRNQLRRLFSEERETSSCSSSETDDLDGISPATYCIWKPKSESPEICKKSNSTGNTSKRWKFRNLLLRSNSDQNHFAGKDLIPSMKKRSEKTSKVAGTDDDVESHTKDNSL